MAKRNAKRKRRAFMPEFKAETVRLCKVGDRTIRQVATDLDLTETALREWVRRADVDAGNGASGALATEERDELKELRKRVKRLEMEREILKKAAVRSTGHRNTMSPEIWQRDAVKHAGIEARSVRQRAGVRADAARLARERDHELVATVVAAAADEAVRKAG